MILLVTYVIALLIGQLIAVAIGLAVERIYTPRAGLLVFIPTYFLMFWVSWQVSKRLTAPRVTA